MKHLLMIAAAVLALSVPAAAQQTTIRDSRGSTVGTATRTGNTTVFRDARGSTTGTATRTGNTTVFRNSRGSTTGTSTGPR
jgi:predicted aconitase with swiveling domain